MSPQANTRPLNPHTAMSRFCREALGGNSRSGAKPAVTRGILLLAAATIGLASADSVAHAQASAPTSIVHAPAGDLQGLAADGVGQFLGIPFAAPPVGDLRWQPPHDAPHWQQTLQATKFANTCVQPQRGVFASPSNTEDCLYLNVFTPKTEPDPAARQPVMVWFYGGGLFSGESNDYDGSKLARRGNVIVVTTNYRVGALGFFSHPAINAEDHPFANYGIMDQQSALRWVQRNIAAFGGDPGNVTIFGQSGGGTAVMSNLVSPLSKGLFHRAINQSGTRIAVTPPATMLKLGEEFAVSAGCADQSAKCLRSLTVNQVLDNQAGILRVVPDFPTVDGTIIPHRALEAFSKGLFNQVPIMTGLVADEQAYFLPEPNTRKPLTADDFNLYAASFGAAHTQTLLAKYPLASYPSPSLAEIAMAQGFKACTARLLDQQWAKYVPVYAYQFADRTAPSYFPDVSYPMRAYHTAELQYLFPRFRGGQGTSHPLNDTQERLSDLMVDYWTTFARTGTPDQSSNHALAPWPRYSVEKDNVLYLDLPGPKIADGYGKANDCDLWDKILNYQ
jgi:para-nitrobenzyl esterase